MARKRSRAVVTLVAFLLALLLAVASASNVVDETLVAACWAAFLAGSVVIVVRSIRTRQTGIHGQLAAVPRSWRRWILDEPDKVDRP